MSDSGIINEVTNGISSKGYEYIIGVLTFAVISLFVLYVRELMRSRKSETEVAKLLGEQLNDVKHALIENKIAQENAIESNNNVIKSVDRNTAAIDRLERKL